ncbi:hypothetical protein Sano_15 [Xylella phage Sano]|uniref:Uncharacterized protein n=1 Tax=Xylella phage Sano TaxID=1415148 RepID=V5Q9E0_9CAUD|nr:hypothetical protein FGG50_gp15 [Xylella phage Sano]AHB12035.1 hypothetical protein Sano_15 [Xylella phage Sano]
MYDKQFTNNAPKPVLLPLIATCNDEGIVFSIHRRRGYHIGLDDGQMAEAERMFQWAKVTFTGQDIVMFQSHNGVVPSPQPGFHSGGFTSSFGQGKSEAAFRATSGRDLFPGTQLHMLSGSIDFLKDNDRRYIVLDDIDPHAIAEAMLLSPGILDLLRVDLLDIEARTGKKEVNIELRVDTGDVIGDLEKWAKKVGMESFDQRVYSKNYNEGPAFSINSYWQSRTEPTKFYRVTGLQQCVRHWHVEMHCLQDGEPEDRVWESTRSWADLFTPVDRETALAPLSPQSSVGPYAYQLDAQAFLRSERASGVEAEFVAEAEAPRNVVDATQQVLDGVPFHGNELPPKVGEQYQRVGSEHIYTVVDVQQGDFNTHTVTLDTHKGGVHYGRNKHTFRDHAQWLAKWRPLDSEGNVKPVVYIDIENDNGAVMQEVREDMLTHNEGENAVRWIRVIGRELDRRVPGWRDYDPPGVLYDDCALIIRAIRTLFRGGVQVESELIAFKDSLKEVEALAEQRLANVEKRDQRIRQMEGWIGEMSRDASRAFRNTFGRDKGLEVMKEMLKEFGHASLLSIPIEDRVSWVRKLSEYTAKAGIP